MDPRTGKLLGPPVSQAAEVLAFAVTPDGRTLLTVTSDQRIHRRPLPAPHLDQSDLLGLWLQVILGADMDDRGIIRDLGPQEWKELFLRLLGAQKREVGSPLPQGEELLHGHAGHIQFFPGTSICGAGIGSEGPAG